MKKLKILVGAILLSSTATTNSLAQSHNFNWSQPLGSVQNEIGYSVCSDPSGNIISTGFFRNTVDFDNGPGTTNLTSAGGADVFVKKTDKDGNLIWAVNLGGTLDDVAFGAATDIFGQVYISGGFSGTMDIDPGAGVSNLTSVGSADIFVVKLDNNGNLAWGHNFGSASGEQGGEIAVDVSGAAYISGFFYNTIDFDPGAGVANLTSNGQADAFLLKLDANGNYLDAWNFGSTTNDDGSDIDIDASGNMYLSGYFTGTTDFDPAAGTQNLISNGAADAFVVKLNSSGVYQWAMNLGGTGNDNSKEIAIDVSNNVVVSGYFNGTVDFDPGAGTQNITSNGLGDIFIAKYDQNGQYLWAHGFGSTQNDEGWGHDTDEDGNIYSTGYCRGTVDFDPGVGTANVITNGSADAFLLKLNANGEYAWAYNFGGATDAHGFTTNVNVNNSVSATGYYSGTTDFDPGVGTSNSSTVGGQDIFLVNFKNCTDFKTDVIASCGPYTWIDGITYTTSNHSAVDTLTNQNGCDSVISLSLTISEIANQTITQNITTQCDSADVTVTTASSENGVTYYLRNNANDAVIDGPIAGDGNGLTFNTGMIYNSTDYHVYAEKQNDFGVSFTASNLDRLEVSNPFTDFNDEISVEAWVKFDNTTANDYLWMTQALFNVDVMPSNVWLWSPVGAEMQWHVNNGGTWITINSTTLGSLDGWHHIATTADASGTAIYVDGVLDASTAVGVSSGIQNSPNATLHIGGDVRYPATVNRHGDFDISEVRIWNVSKSQSEIQGALNSCMNGSEAGLVYYNKINDNSGTLATASIGEDAQFSTNMDVTDWVLANNLCDPMCTTEMTQLASVTIHQPTTSTVIESVCDDYTWAQTGLTYTVTGMYNDTISNVAGCDSIVTLDLTVNAINVAVSTAEPTITAVQTGATYQWLDCDDNNAVIAGETSQSFTATSNGNYAVEVTVNGCVDTSACTQIANIGFEKLQSFEVSIYPNPTNGEVWINVSELGQDMRVAIYSLDGKQILETSLQNQTQLIDLTGFASGYYTIKVSSETESFISKIRLF